MVLLVWMAPTGCGAVVESGSGGAPCDLGSGGSSATGEPPLLPVWTDTEWACGEQHDCPFWECHVFDCVGNICLYARGAPYAPCDGGSGSCSPYTGECLTD
jgi:hypothetical protein